MERFNVFTNPICVQHARARLRLMPTLSWGLITLTCVAFIYVLIYFLLIKRGEVSPVDAAKAAVVPLIVVQGVLLMGMGTSAVATGIARERDRELLDYHRMSPMTPAAKIIGYLFGLPSREYFLFALTLPFVAYAVLRGGVPLLKVAHFYVAFFSSVWLYHMTGLMAGMVSRKPWHSSFVSLGSVVVLYLVLPLFARVGLSFFDFLTVRPTFYGMVYEEIQSAGQRPNIPSRIMLAQQYETVPFYGLSLNPTAFSLVVQVFVLTAMYHVVRRKWVDAAWHPFSKRFSLFFVFGVVTLLVGSIWPLLFDTQVHDELVDRMQWAGDTVILSLLIGLFFVVSGLAVLMTISLTTPTAQTSRKGLRRARKRGLDRIPLSWDAATSVPTMLVVLLIAVVGYVVVLLAIQSGPVYEIKAGMERWLVALGVLSVLVVVAFQGMHERFGQRPVILGLFVFWVMPVMVGIIMFAAFDAWRPAMYIGALCPAVAGAMSLALLLDASAGQVVDGSYLLRGSPVEDHARMVVAVTIVLYAGLAVIAQGLRYSASCKRKRLERDTADLAERVTPRREVSHQPNPPPQVAG
ncbi:MAG: hypothetical protein AAF593_07640 [Planctomycetota bacterium]